MAAVESRPQTALASSKFSTTGTMARAAGVPGMYGTVVPSNFPYGVALPKATGLLDHALKFHSPYAETAVRGWTAPGREPSIKPRGTITGAGVVSAGSIDNTYLPAPLVNAWGKKREQAKNEVVKPPHKQASDLIIVSKGAPAGTYGLGFKAPPQTVEDMEAVRPIYSRTIPVYHPMDPVRIESGFVRSPNLIPGAKPPPQSALVGQDDKISSVPANHALRKLAYDQSLIGGKLPVAKVILADAPRPSTAAPKFLTKPAGLPGGLSLID